jgi:uncharacterized cupin superfamily protein
MCDCEHCKAKRNCKTKEEYIEFLKGEIEIDKRILANKNVPKDDKWLFEKELRDLHGELEAIESGEYKPIKE